MIHINKNTVSAQNNSFAEIYNRLFKKILEIKAIPEEAQTKSTTQHLMLLPCFARRMPKAFKDELRAKGSYQANRFMVHIKKTKTEAGGGLLISYLVYMYSRLRNADGEKIGVIGGSGATIEEATNVFIEALRAVKLPPQE